MYKRLKQYISIRLLPLKLLLNSGSKFTCPFCNYSSKKLSIIGAKRNAFKKYQVIGGERRNGGCIKCGSKDRERLIYIYLKEKTRIIEEREKWVLHIAPEKNLMQKMIDVGFTNYICGDLFYDGYKYPDNVQNIDVLNIPFKAETFDLIICNHVLEHIEEDVKAMKELHRVLKKTGQAILQVPISKNTFKTFEDDSVTDPKERTKVFGQRDHVRIYGQDYEERLKTSGFNVSRINISMAYSEFGLNPDEDIFVVEK